MRLFSSSSTQLRRVLVCHYQRQHPRFLNIFSIFSKAAVEKERQRLGDELNRGYFDDYRDLKKHNGKLAIARQSLLPASTAIKFPALLVRTASGEKFTLPVDQNVHDEDETAEAVPSTSASVALVCIAFRGHGQGLVGSWLMPFVDTFKGARNIQIYEVFYIDQWFLSLAPVRYLLLRSMRPKEEAAQHDETKKVVYAFGDSYDFRKELHITNLLTGYVFLLDEQWRVRWQAYGKSTEEEVLSMVSCTKKLLNEQNSDLNKVLEGIGGGMRENPFWPLFALLWYRFHNWIRFDEENVLLQSSKAEPALVKEAEYYKQSVKGGRKESYMNVLSSL